MGHGKGSAGLFGSGTPEQGMFGDLFGKSDGMLEGAGRTPIQPQQVALPGYSDFKVGLFGRLSPEELAQWNQENNVTVGRMKK